MELKDIWVDLEDKVQGDPDSGSEISVKPINNIAHSVIKNEEKIKELENKEIEITIDAEMSNESENPVQNKVVKNYVDGLVGDINSALDELHNYAQALISGGVS